MRRDAGLTVIEAAVLCFIVLTVIALLLPIPTGDRCRSKHSSSQATIQDFSVALKAYEADFGDYPPDEPGNFITRGGKGSLVDLLSMNGPKNVPYYQFRADRFNTKGQWLSDFETPFKYRKNAGKARPLAVSPLTMMNVFTFDLWASGCGDAPACDPATSEPADKSTLRNW